MGTKGRDLLLWLFTLTSLVVLALSRYPSTLTWAKGLLWVAILSAGMILWFICYTLPKAHRDSRKQGFGTVVLLPVNRWWALLLIYLSGERICGTPRRAYEIHILFSKELSKLSIWEFLKRLEDDLILAKDSLPGCLFLWETPAPVPSTIRQLIRDLAVQGNAFWQTGRWPIPELPFLPSLLKKKKRHVHRGALLLSAEGGDNP
ncbi:MAG: hypothetical protein H0Z39_03485 [Peptococcaceae bacterium]|nr:hypothetical protein [Peptococcaceae bacterium]